MFLRLQDPHPESKIGVPTKRIANKDLHNKFNNIINQLINLIQNMEASGHLENHTSYARLFNA